MAFGRHGGREPPVMVVELQDGTFHLEGRDWFFNTDTANGRRADEMAAKIETLRRKWYLKSLEWVAEQCP